MGGDDPDEYAAVGTPLAGRSALFDRQLDELADVFSTALVGNGYEFRDLPPVAPPPVWVGGRSTAAAQRAAGHADGFLPYLVTAEQLKVLVDTADEERVRIDASEPLDHAVSVLVALGDSEAEGRALAAEAAPFGMNDELRAKYVIAGPTPYCVEQLSRYAQAGARHLIVNLAVPSDHKDRQMIQLAEEVVPQIRGCFDNADRSIHLPLLHNERPTTDHHMKTRNLS